MVRTASLAVAVCAASGVVAACGSSQSVPVVAGKTTASTPAATSSPTRPAKPASEQVPDSKMLTVALKMAPRTTAERSAVLTDPAKIAQIAGEINALPTLPRYPLMNCPMEIDGPYLTLVFRDSASTAPLAQVRLNPQPSGACSQGVQVLIGGVSKPALDDSAQPKLYSDIMQTAGLTVR